MTTVNTNTDSIPVILRQTEDGELIALLPSLPVTGLKTTVVAYNEVLGWFQTDTSVMHSTTSADTVNTWGIISALIQKEGIKPIKICKRITSDMTEKRLDKARNSWYRAEYA